MILLEQKRKERNMSQQRLAEVSGVAQQTISKIENGESENPGINTLHRLAVALECPLFDIYRPDRPGGVAAPKLLKGGGNHAD